MIVFLADHRGVDAGDAQAAFFAFVLAAAFEDHRVDEHALGVFRRGVAFGVADEQPVRQVDLIRREADALVLVHQLEHLGDHAASARRRRA